MSIHESGENYLEKILMLSQQKSKVRAIDICQSFGFSRPTVSVMLRELRDGGFVTTAANGGLALTEKGEAVARRIYERHCVLSEALMRIGVSHDTAVADACKIEHDISEESLLCVKRFLSAAKEDAARPAAGD